jgi:hypothetical protein
MTPVVGSKALLNVSVTPDKIILFPSCDIHDGHPGGVVTILL